MVESAFRGRIEKEVDRLLKPDVINMIVRISKNLPLRSIADFCFGYIVGDVVVGTYEEARVRYGRDAASDELEEALNIVKRRTIEIRGAIEFALNK
jgi:hypothetical protein